MRVLRSGLLAITRHICLTLLAAVLLAGVATVPIASEADASVTATNTTACAELNTFINKISVYSFPSSEIGFVDQLIAAATQLEAVLGC